MSRVGGASTAPSRAGSRPGTSTRWARPRGGRRAPSRRPAAAARITSRSGRRTSWTPTTGCSGRSSKCRRDSTRSARPRTRSRIATTRPVTTTRPSVQLLAFASPIVVSKVQAHGSVDLCDDRRKKKKLPQKHEALSIPALSKRGRHRRVTQSAQAAQLSSLASCGWSLSARDPGGDLGSLPVPGAGRPSLASGTVEGHLKSREHFAVVAPPWFARRHGRARR